MRKIFVLCMMVFTGGFLALESPAQENNEKQDPGWIKLWGVDIPVPVTTNVFWNVSQGSALSSLVRDMEPPPKAGEEERQRFYDKIARGDFYGFHLNKNFLDTGGAAEPAMISYTRKKGSDKQLQIEGSASISYPQIHLAGDRRLNFYLGAQTALTETDKPTSDTQTYFLLARLSKKPTNANDPKQGLLWLAGPTYTRDRITDVDKWDFVLEMQPWESTDDRDKEGRIEQKKAPPMQRLTHLNRANPHPDAPKEERVDFLLRPRFAIETNIETDGKRKGDSVFDTSTTNGVSTAAIRTARTAENADWIARWGVEFKIAMGKRFDIGYAFTQRYNIEDFDEHFDLQSASFNIGIGNQKKALGQHYSIVVGWKKGRDFPSYERTEQWDIGVGLRF